MRKRNGNYPSRDNNGADLPKVPDGPAPGAPELPEGYEEALVTLDNVAWVAERAGKDEQQLRMMLMVRDLNGKELRVQYKVVNEVAKKERRWFGRKKK